MNQGGQITAQDVPRRGGGTIELTEAEREIREELGPASDEERRRVARLFAGKRDEELFGETEFQLRDRVRHLATSSLEQAVAQRLPNTLQRFPDQGEWRLAYQRDTGPRSRQDVRGAAAGGC